MNSMSEQQKDEEHTLRVRRKLLVASRNWAVNDPVRKEARFAGGVELVVAT
jgi:hypothetical protein